MYPQLGCPACQLRDAQLREPPNIQGGLTTLGGLVVILGILGIVSLFGKKHDNKRLN